MICTAASYLAASPNPESSSPMCLLAMLVVQAPSAAEAAMSRTSLEDMTVILLKTEELGLGHAARAADGRQRRWRWRRSDERSRGRRHAGIGATIQEQVGLVRWPDVVSRSLEDSGGHRTHQTRRHNDHQLG